MQAPPAVEKLKFSKEQRDAVWEGLVAVFGKPDSEGHEKRFGKTQRALLASRSLTPEQVASEIPARANRYRQKWPGVDLTLEAFAKHWPDLRNGNGDAPAAAVGLGLPDHILEFGPEYDAWHRTATVDERIEYQTRFNTGDRGYPLSGPTF